MSDIHDKTIIRILKNRGITLVRGTSINLGSEDRGKIEAQIDGDVIIDLLWRPIDTDRIDRSNDEGVDGGDGYDSFQVPERPREPEANEY